MVSSCPCADGLKCVPDGGREVPQGPTGKGNELLCYGCLLYSDIFGHLVTLYIDRIYRKCFILAQTDTIFI